MELNIGERIKMLRTERGITQDKFAAFLGIECRTLDHWERGDELPPLALIPTIASYFEVTCDLLMCMDEFDNSDKIREYIEKFQEFISVGNLADAVGIMREGLVHFPKNYRLKCMLMYALYLSCNRPAAIKHLSPEILSISEDILSGCTDDAIRLEAKRVLCLHYYDDLHDVEHARAIARTLPGRSSSREDMLPHVSEGEGKLRAIQENIAAYLDRLTASIIEYADTAEVDGETAEKLCKMALKMRAAIYPEGDFMLGYVEMMKLNCRIAEIKAAAGDKDGAFAYLTAAAECAACYDDLPQIIPQMSPLVNLLTFNKSKIDALDLDSNRSMREVCLNEILTLDCFECVRYDQRMSEIYNTLKIKDFIK